MSLNDSKKQTFDSDTCGVISGMFRYDTFSADALSEKFFYADAYFLHGGEAFDPHLRMLSLAAALCLSDKTEYAEEFLSALGFDADSFRFDETDSVTPDSLGSIIACKPLEDAVLVAVVLRGQRYGTEWNTNVAAGESGDIMGLACSAEKVLERLSEYIRSNKILRAKLWVTGYSRAGSVANLVGRALNEDPGAFASAKEDIFVYTFEALRCSADKTVYGNIHNVYDPDDLVAYLFPSQWGLGLNGVEETIGGGEKITGKIMCLGDDGSFTADYSQIGKAEFIERFSAFTARYMTRECYNAIIQEPLRDFVVMFFGKSYVDQGKLMRAVTKIAESFQSDERFIPAMMSLLAEPCDETVLGDTASLIFEHLDKIRHQDNLPLNDDETRIVKTTLRAFMTFLAPAVEADLCCAPEEGAEEVSFYHFMTFALGCGELLKAHVPESVLAAVKADDNYYSL